MKICGKPIKSFMCKEELSFFTTSQEYGANAINAKKSTILKNCLLKLLSF